MCRGLNENRYNLWLEVYIFHKNGIKIFTMNYYICKAAKPGTVLCSML